MLLILGGFIVGALISPIAGMAISSTRSLILGMAPDEAILTLADKIDQESGRNDIQQQAITDLNTANEQQKEQLGELGKSQEIASCQKRKEDCGNKLYDLDNSELPLQINLSGVWKGSRTEMIKRLQRAIASWEKNKKETEDASSKKDLQDSIDNAEKGIEKIRAIMASEAVEKSNLLAGECKDYQNSCE